MRYSTLVTAVAFGLTATTTATTARAAGEGNLAAGLAALPAMVFDGQQPAVFVDLEAVAAVFGDAPLAPGMAQRASLGLELPVLRAALSLPAADFAAASGLPPGTLRFIAAHGARPDEALVWGVGAEGAAALRDGLPGLGFAVLEAQGGILANGEPGAYDLSQANGTGPWAGPMGEASLLNLGQDRLYQAWTLPALAAVTAAPSAADSPAGRALAESYSGATITQAMLFSAGFGVAASEAAPATAVMPAYLGAMLADVQTEAGAAAVLAFVYPDCALAEAAAASLGEGWRIPATVPPVIATLPAPSACLATVTLPDTTGETARNLAFWAVYSALMTRDFVPVATP